MRKKCECLGTPSLPDTPGSTGLLASEPPPSLPRLHFCEIPRMGDSTPHHQTPAERWQSSQKDPPDSTLPGPHEAPPPLPAGSSPSGQMDPHPPFLAHSRPQQPLPDLDQPTAGEQVGKRGCSILGGDTGQPRWQRTSPFFPRPAPSWMALGPASPPSPPAATPSRGWARPAAPRAGYAMRPGWTQRFLCDILGTFLTTLACFCL